jgi:hypothetical protein
MLKSITGEYWIIDGTANYADGDVSDTNHEGYALDYLRRRVLDALEVYPDDCYDWEAEIQNIPEALCEKLGMNADDLEFPAAERDVHDELVRHADALELDPEDITMAFYYGTMDVRDYMGKKHGWIVLHGNRAGCWFLTRDTLKQIAEGVDEILGEEGSEDEDDDVELTIHVASTCKTYEVLLSELKAEDFSSFPLKEEEPEIGPNAQVAAMDREITHPYYKSPCE